MRPNEVVRLVYGSNLLQPERGTIRIDRPMLQFVSNGNEYFEPIGTAQMIISVHGLGGFKKDVQRVSNTLGDSSFQQSTLIRAYINNLDKIIGFMRYTGQFYLREFSISPTRGDVWDMRLKSHGPVLTGPEKHVSFDNALSWVESEPDDLTCIALRTILFAAEI